MQFEASNFAVISIIQNGTTVHLEAKRAYHWNAKGLRELAAELTKTADELDGNAEKSKPNPVPAPMTPQAKTILEHLKTGNTISNVEAQAVYKCRALPRRIADLKSHGYVIETAIHRDLTGQRYARYHLIGHKADAPAA